MYKSNARSCFEVNNDAEVTTPSILFNTDHCVSVMTFDERNVKSISLAEKWAAKQPRDIRNSTVPKGTPRMGDLRCYFRDCIVVLQKCMCCIVVFTVMATFYTSDVDLERICKIDAGIDDTNEDDDGFDIKRDDGSVSSKDFCSRQVKEVVRVLVVFSLFSEVTNALCNE
uniref:Uncharacterized protein n=1 Tax=Glossina austeni TaxID=7395 RepID=A0A1A9V4M8_GLOAU